MNDFDIGDTVWFMPNLFGDAWDYIPCNLLEITEAKVISVRMGGGNSN